MAKLICYGGAGTATGANFFLEVGGRKVLVDCGMVQGVGGDEENHKPFAYNPSTIDYLFITHSHIDHIGRIPKLVHEGFKGEIYSTKETKEIAALLLADAVKIGLENEAPLYNLDDVSLSLTLWKTLNYHEVKDFGGFTVELYDAGHVLGSAMIKINSMLFTGDLGNSPSVLLPDVEKVEGLEYLLMESVYGDRNHENREEREDLLVKGIREGIERGGAILIPSFSLERAQETLMRLDKLNLQVPVYLDSPLAEKITLIFEKFFGRDPFEFKELHHVLKVADSHQTWEKPGPKIIIAGSGMSTAGRILSHEEKYLPDPSSTILILGYQAPGTLGRLIAEGAKEVSINDHQIKVLAKVVKIYGFSGHADSNALVEFVSHSASTLKKVLVAMGEPHSAIFLAQRLHDELNLDAVVAEKGKVYEISI